MTLQQIMYFTEVARTQHFTRAAQNLYVSQSALSYSIQNLEKELGVPLFVRKKSGNKIELTSYGRVFVPYCEEMLDKLNKGKAEIERLRNPLSGIVTIVYAYINCHELVPNIFNDFYSERENEDILIHFFANHEKGKFEDEILSGNAELGFSCSREYPGLATTPIATQDLTIYVSVLNPLSKYDELAIEDIKDESIIGMGKTSNLYYWVDDMFKSCGLKPNIIINYQDWASSITYVSLNQGIAILPDLPFDSRAVKKIKIDHPMSKRNIYMLWQKDKVYSETTEYIKRYCIRWSKEHFGEIKEFD